MKTITNERIQALAAELQKEFAEEGVTFAAVCLAGDCDGDPMTAIAMYGAFPPEVLAESLIDVGLQTLRAFLGKSSGVQLVVPGSGTDAVN